MPSSIEILEQLRELFPLKPLAYLVSVATYFQYDGPSFEAFVRNAVEFQQFPVLPKNPDNVLDSHLEAQKQYIWELLPDAEDAYLQELFESHAGSRDMEAILFENVAFQNYPKKQAQVNDEVFDVGLYHELVPDPKASYNHRNYIMKDDMKVDATNFLVKIFGEGKRTKIAKVIDEKEALYLAYKMLLEAGDQANLPLRREERTRQPRSFESPDYTQSFEKLFIEYESEILSYMEQKREEDEKLFKSQEEKGTLVECQICCLLTSTSNIIKICSDGHKMCKVCALSLTEKYFYRNIMFFPCAFCNLYINISVIRSVWDTHKFSQLLEARASKTVTRVPCPFCKFDNEESDKQELACHHCKKIFCKACNKKGHAPLTCNQKEDEICKEVEETMTMALIRICPSCKTQFIKEPKGCNRVTCVNPMCKISMCYICRKIVSGTDYKHFYGQGTMPSEAPGRCPLHTDINKLHVQNVIASGKASFEKLKNENPDTELLYNPLDVLPVEEESDAVPNQY